MERAATTGQDTHCVDDREDLMCKILKMQMETTSKKIDCSSLIKCFNFIMETLPTCSPQVGADKLRNVLEMTKH
jgi:hypothetical protein